MMEWSLARVVAHDIGVSMIRPTERISLADAVGRTLTASLACSADLPAQAVSAMDGWAVAGEPPWLLGHAILAGDPPDDERLSAGVARGIATGGAVPTGTLGILRTESGTVSESSTGHTHLRRSATARLHEPRAGEHVRAAGEELSAGETFLVAGDILTAPRVALAAVTGHDTVEVAAAITVDLLLLGSEIVRTGAARPGEVRDAFSPQFPAVFRALGLADCTIGFVRDDLDDTIARVAASDATVLVTTGGTARGPADNMREAINATGAALLIDGVSMRPGHPIMLAQRPDGRLLLCLPGNPLAAMLGLATIGAALIDGMLGRPLARLGWVPLAVDCANTGAHTRLVSYRQSDDGATPTTHQGSAMLRGLAQSDGVAVIPSGGSRAGQTVRTLPLPW